MDNTEQKLRLVISNVEDITGGTSSSHTFDKSGGSVGGGSADTWEIKESSKPSVNINHLRVEFIDGRYCLREKQGDIYLNGATSTLGKRKVTALSDGDSFFMGKYKVRVLFLNDNQSNRSNIIGQMSLEEVVSSTDSCGSTSVVDQLINSVEPNPVTKSKKLDQSNIDILELHEMSESERSKVDPLLALQEGDQDVSRRESAVESMLGNSGNEESNTDSALETQQDIGSTTQASFTDKGIPTDDFGDIESELRRMGGNEQLASGVSSTTSVSTVGATTSNNMNDEMQESLRVAIAGLKMLYTKGDKDGVKPALSSIPLQPIEDNPIRLDHSLEETMNMFYSGKVSPVFLSAPAAIKESLDNIKHDQMATETAIEESLQELLQALSPETLLQRFKRYAPQNSGENTDAWAWKMYGYYYSELMTGRQNGFNRLFQELFSQSYDREMRRLQKLS